MRHLAVATLVCLLALSGSASAEVERLYLLSTDGGSAYFSTDADDPEAAGGSLAPGCGVFVTAATRLCQSTFYPAAALDAPLSWSAAAPLRFHAELLVEHGGNSAVTFFVEDKGRQFETPPAKEVRPGVWEAELAGPGKTDPKNVIAFGVRLRGPDAIALETRTRGRSWVDLPAPVVARSVSQLLAADPVPTDPTTHVTDQRRFSFSDADWSAHRFEGTLAASKTYSVELPRGASAVYAWAEHDDRPAVQTAAGGNAPDPEAMLDSPLVYISRGSTGIGVGNASSRAAADVPAGPLEISVNRTATTVRPKPYVLHVVVVHGARTLRSMRWRTTVKESFHAGLVTQCPHTFDPLVVPAASTTFSVGLTWSSPNPLTRWALAYDLPTVGSFVCGYPTTDPRVRFVVPRATRIWLFEPRIVSGRGPAVSVLDTTFEFEARLTY